MSCYIVRTDLIEELAESIRFASDNPNNSGCMYLCTRPLQYEFADCMNRNGYSQKLIAEKLYRFNERAFCDRYKDEKPAEIAPDFKPANNPLIFSKYRLMHILEEYMYQVSEDATQNDSLYKALDDFLTSLYKSEIRKTAAYKSADLYA